MLRSCAGYSARRCGAGRNRSFGNPALDRFRFTETSEMKTITERRSYRLVDPECRGPLEMLDNPAPTDETLPALRIASVPVAKMIDVSVEPGVTLTERSIPGPQGAPDVRLLILTPTGMDSATPALLYFHGGGFIAGGPDIMVGWGSKLAKQVGCTVVLPAYRLAPETRWPGPIEDLHAALCWVSDNAPALGIDPARIAVGGGSAGGGYAAALALRVRKLGGPKILYQLLMFPMLDDRPTENPYAGEFGWSREHDCFGWTALLGMPAGSEEVPAGAVPGRVHDLSGLPPAYIGIGALDLFVDANLDYAKRLMHCGVPVELHVFPGGYHGFDFVAPNAAISQVAIADIPRVLRSAFARAATL
jgi:acetyl esterase/lipase